MYNGEDLDSVGVSKLKSKHFQKLNNDNAKLNMKFITQNLSK